MSSLKLKPSDRQSIDFAEEERLKSQSESGAIIHEEDIAGINHIETIYDMDSVEANINLGYTGGIAAGTTITGLDLSKYHYLRVYVILDKSNGAFNVDLRKTRRSTDLVPNYSYNGGLSMPIDTAFSNIYVSVCRVSNDKTEFIHITTGYVNAGTYNERLNNSYFVYRIEGVVLK